MKRFIISIAIICAIVAAGIFSCAAVYEKNTRLYGHITGVLEAYGSDGDVGSEISSLESFFEKEYAPGLCRIVNDERIGEISVMISRLRAMYQSDCDEFTSECEAIKKSAENIFRAELPDLYRLL